jgi:hypothetical protein
MRADAAMDFQQCQFTLHNNLGFSERINASLKSFKMRDWKNLEIRKM